jgi:plastocyanin
MYWSRLTIVSLALGLTFCGGGGGGDATAPPDNGGSMSNPPAPGTVAVSIRDFAFSPATLSIKAGTTVRWTNAGPSAHTTVSDDGIWTSGTLGAPNSGGGGSGYGGGGSAGGTFEFTFANPGTYGYHCNLHPPSSYPGFVGTITVTP